MSEHAIAEVDVPSQSPQDAPEARRLPGKRQYAKVMQKMGLKPEPEITRITIRKAKNVCFNIATPEVYKYPGSDAYVIFGEPSFTDESATDFSRAAQQFTAGHEAPNQSTVEEIEEDQTADGLEEKDIELVMSQAMVSRNKAIKALRENDGDIVNTIMALTM
eukprot:CAMPEP_0201521774 /NCGR_PEP_ID=MMETSP0161_2-20130828/16167_1 /ASSEMBLY_ACC=CAM_ASM_000251 /TAXON_ID=180227 /ORGANISM="Neoparamoeba aestuarina, Strain SoJaBio B1-5/56/2" /LENGTH=161 /DNA_ID=CAMNT_0047920475 /DNA_START=19 /DNA_END=504 /DNA_ORIENTATION=-